jgi:hypothetical protein
MTEFLNKPQNLQYFFSVFLRRVLWWLDIKISEDPKDGGSTVLRNVDIQPRHFTTQKPQNHRENLKYKVELWTSTEKGNLWAETILLPNNTDVELSEDKVVPLLN